uniref:hypothetical protein n=1 Tax=Klebsiella pneumoniae TaxID=573 RepID=UPI001D0E0C94|nr:hypothetical protein [Klebsiella pneumoniae]
MNKRLHLITTCTRRKAGSVEDTVFPGDTSLDDAFDGSAPTGAGVQKMSTELNQPAITARIIPNNRRMVELWAYVRSGLGSAPPYRSGGRV